MDKAVLTYDKTVERTFFNLIYSSYLADSISRDDFSHYYYFFFPIKNNLIQIIAVVCLYNCCCFCWCYLGSSLSTNASNFLVWVATSSISTMFVSIIVLFLLVAWDRRYFKDICFDPQIANVLSLSILFINQEFKSSVRNKNNIPPP